MGNGCYRCVACDCIQFAHDNVDYKKSERFNDIDSHVVSVEEEYDWQTDANHEVNDKEESIAPTSN